MHGAQLVLTAAFVLILIADTVFVALTQPMLLHAGPPGRLRIYRLRFAKAILLDLLATAGLIFAIVNHLTIVTVLAAMLLLVNAVDLAKYAGKALG